ncbi:Flp pilus assembly protein TadG [Bradyrhizobium sp. USDA 4516]|uniref:TadE/TadG family type IV pilus assembly protein n=1 Tax=Bradyrhizobium sp. BR 1433 TaxID=3447967 RepID=UPI003EE4CBC9
MRRLDQRGVAALEFCLVFVPLCLAIFAIFDLARYAITLQSLRSLANAGARTIMIGCYSTAVISKNTPSSCGGDPLPTDAAKQAVAPFLYANGYTPTLNAPATATSPIVVTASSPSFKMLMPIWGTTLNAPSVTTKIPF